MQNIEIKEKPEYISYETIREVLHDAHKLNFENGIVLHTTTFTAQEIEEYIGEEGKCFVAISENKVLGTASYRIIERSSWYVQGKVVDEVLVGIRPEFKGMHLYSRLYEAIERDAIKNGYKLIVFNTAEKNVRKQKISSSHGFDNLSFFAAEDNDHYSVVMGKWLQQCPYSSSEIRFKYLLKKIFVKIRYKPGKIKRFGL